MATNFKTEILRNDKWLARARQLPCVVSGMLGPNDAAHIRYGFYTAGMKPPDDRVVPLTHELHMKQHGMGEVAFWREVMTDPANAHFMMGCLKAYAEKLYRENNGL